MKTQQLRPRVLVSYVREPYVYAAGNVRVSFDSNIRTSLFQRDFLNGALPDIIATDAPGDIILEADGQPVSVTSDLLTVRRSHSVGDTIRLTIQRDGQTLTVDVVLYASK